MANAKGWPGMPGVAVGTGSMQGLPKPPGFSGGFGEFERLMKSPFKPLTEADKELLNALKRPLHYPRYGTGAAWRVPAGKWGLADVLSWGLPRSRLKNLLKATSAIIAMSEKPGDWLLPDDPKWGISWCQPGTYTGKTIGVGGTLYCGPITETGITEPGVHEDTEVTVDGINHYWQFVAYDATPDTIGHWYTGWWKQLWNGDWWPDTPPPMPVQNTIKFWSYLPPRPHVTHPPMVWPETQPGFPGKPPPPPYRPRPPGKGKKEKKQALTVTGTLVGWLFSTVTELLDVLNCLVDSIDAPGKPRPRWDPTRHNGQGGWRRPTPQQRAAWAYQHADRLDVPAFIQCMIANQIEDAIIGRIGELVKSANQRRGFIAGLTFGAAL